MKKILKEAISVLMISALVLGLFAVAASADTEYLHFDSMFTIGDSNAMGFGLPGYQGKNDPHAGSAAQYQNDLYKNGTPGSFPNLVAEELGIARENHTAMAYPAQRSIDALYFLNGDVEMDDYFYDASINHEDYGWLRQTIRDSGGTVTEGSEEHTLGTYFSDTIKQNGENGKQLVVMYSGAADIFHYMVINMSEVVNGVSADNILPLVEKGINVLWNGYNNFVEYTPKLIERILALDPDCTLVILGTFNPMKDVKISEDDALPLLETLGVITNMQNAYYREWAEKYGAIYVDIPNVETATLENNLTLDTIFGKTEGFDAESIYHGTPDGYAYISRQILAQLKTEKPDLTKNIVVDMGSVRSVDSVSVNAVRIADYTYDPATHMLVVPYHTRLGTVMTLTEKMGNGDAYIAIYSLKWTENGYSAKRIFASKSLLESINGILARITGAVRRVMDAVKNLVPDINVPV